MEKIIGIITVKQRYPLHYSHCFHQSHFPSPSQQKCLWKLPSDSLTHNKHPRPRMCQQNQAAGTRCGGDVERGCLLLCCSSCHHHQNTISSLRYNWQICIQFFSCICQKKRGRGNPGWGRKNLTKRVPKFFIKSHFSGLCLRD